MAPPLLDQLAAIAARVTDIARADARQLDDLKTELLGRKAGALTAILRSLPTIPPEERREVGQRANALRREIEDALEARRAALADTGPSRRVDPTMPGRARWRGALHPVTQVVDEICEIFRELGFARVVGPEAETEAYNFTKLNIPLDHPAADMHDTFYLGRGIVLRTHTSPVQARVMENYPPPIRVVVPGLVYRRDPFDPSHAPVFEQIEGLVVDEGVTFVDFKAAIDYFVHRFFARDTAVRFRPSYFPFTEPSAEVDVQCSRRAAWIPSGTRATPTEWAPAASRWCGMGSRTFACSTRTTCGSSTSSWSSSARLDQLAQRSPRRASGSVGHRAAAHDACRGGGHGGARPSRSG
jgi:phenylalanyl-tRNA synthetase alpha chain